MRPAQSTPDRLVFHLAYLAHFPFWSFVMIIIDILIIYGLIAHVETYEPT